MIPKVLWISLTILLGFLTALFFMNAIYWVSGFDQEYTPKFMAGTIILPLLFGCITRWAWTRARASDKQKEIGGVSVE